MGGESGGTPLAPAPTVQGGVGDIAPSTTGNYSLSGMASSGKDFSQSVNALASFGTKTEQPYMVGQSLGQRFDAQNDPQMGLGKLDSAYADQKGKTRLKAELLGMASKGVSDLASFRNFGFTPQGISSENTPAWQKGFGVGEMYNPLMQQAMQKRQAEAVMKYKQGRGV